MRICLIGLPRCGSQYISSTIAHSFSGMTNLIEPFTPGRRYSIIEQNARIRRNSVETKFNSHQDQIDHVITTLKKGKIEQSLVLKLFLTNDILEFLEEILKELGQLDFKFLIIKRENIEHQLLSWLIADASKKWSTDDGLHTEPVEIKDLTCADWLYKDILNFDKLILQFNILADVIRYEHAHSDLYNSLHIPICTNIRLKKQIVGSPYRMITNANEVKEHIEKLLR
jgi:hypothetical protein